MYGGIEWGRGGRKRAQFLERRIRAQVWEEKRWEGKGIEELKRRDRERERKERWEAIRSSRYSKWYGRVKGEGIPGYLRKGWGKVDGKGWQDSGWGMR